MGTCYNPEYNTNCVDVCKAAEVGFYKGLDGEIFDYDFNAGEEKQIDAEGHAILTEGGDKRYPQNGAEIEDNIEKHNELCRLKRTQKIQEYADKTGSSNWMSPGELAIWLIVAAVMYGAYVMYDYKMPFKESFLCNDLNSSSIFNMKNIGKLYVILCFTIIFVIRKVSQTKTLQKIDLLSIKEYILDFLPYCVISIGAYVFFSGYLRIKSSEEKMSGGGPMEFFKNMSTTALTVYIGILLMVINAFGLSYFYLKQKHTFRKDKYAQSLYWGQISTLLIGGLTAIFVAFSACHGIMGTGNMYKPIFILVKWVTLTLLVIGCIYLVNTLTSVPHKYIQTTEGLQGKEHWFGNSTRAEREYISGQAAAAAAYQRDVGYLNNATAEEWDEGEKEGLNDWKRQAFNYVHGPCHNQPDQTTCQVTGSDFAGVCKWDDGAKTCSENKCSSNLKAELSAVSVVYTGGQAKGSTADITCLSSGDQTATCQLDPADPTTLKWSVDADGTGPTTCT